MSLRRLLYLGLALILLVLITPAGPWLLGRLLVQLAPAWGWELHIGQASGAFISQFRFSHLQAASAADSLEIGLEQVAFSPWRYAVELRRPDVRLRLGAAPDTTAPDMAATRLPVEYFPHLVLGQGSLHLIQAADRLEIRLEDCQARYQATGDTTGELNLAVTRWQVVQGGQEQLQGELQGRLLLEPSLISAQELHAILRAAPLQVQLQGSGALGLAAPLPARFRLSAHLQTDSLQAQVEVGAQGALSPLAVQVALNGQGEFSGWGPVALVAQGAVDTARAVADSVRLEGMGGLAQGRLIYHLSADSLDIQATLAHLDLSRISASKGQVDAALRAGANLRLSRYSGDLEAQVCLLEVLPEGPLDLRLEALLQPDRTLRVAARSRLGELIAAGQLDPEGSYDLELSGELDPSPILGFLAAPVRLGGWARADSVRLRLETAQLPIRGVQLGPARADLSLAAGRHLEAVLRLVDDQVSLRLRADLQEDRLDTLSATIAPLSLARLDPALGGTVQGQVRASGSLDLQALHASGRLLFQDAAYHDWQLGDLEADLTYRAWQARLLLSGPGWRASAALDPRDRFTGQLELDHLVLSRAADSASLSGQLHFAGNLEHPENVQLSALFSDLALRQGDWEVRAADTLRAAYRQQRLVLEPLTLHTPAGPLRLAGSAGADSLDLQAELPELALHALAAELGGSGRVHAQLRGTLEHPRLQAEAILRQVELAGQPLGELAARLELADTLALQATLEQNRDLAPELTIELALPAAPLLNGVADTSSGAFRLVVKADQLDLRAPLSALLADSTGGQLGLDGQVRLPLSLLADPERWHQLEGQVLLRGLQVEKQNLRLYLPADAQAAIRLAGDHLEVEGLELFLEAFDPERDQSVRAGALGLSGVLAPEAASRLDLEVQDLDLRVLEQLGQEELELPEGVAGLQAQLSGTLKAPRLDARLNAALEDLGDLAGRFRGAQEGGELELEWIALTGDSLQVSARLPWDLSRGIAAWERGSLRARSAGFSLLPLLDQLPELENLSGTLSLDLEVDGLAAAPQVKGQVEVADLELTVLDVKPGYFFPGGRLEFSGSRGEFRDFVGRPLRGEGRAELSGYVELPALDSLVYDLRLQAEDLPLNYDDIFVAPALDLSGRFSSTLSGSLLRCDLRLDNARAEVPLIDLNAPPVPPPPATVKDPFLENMALEVSADVRNLSVENELVDVRLEGLSRIDGTFYKPRFQGGLEILDGKVFVLNREFVFQKGRISLDRTGPTYSILDLAYEPLLLNPEMDVEATTSVRPNDEDEDYEVTLKLQGPALQAVPQFTSVPATSPLQLLGLLAFGSLSQSQYDYQSALYTAAGQLLLSRQVKKIGLDEFQILPSGTLLETVGKPSVRLGKYFKFPLPLRMGYEASTQDPSWGEFRVEHRLGSYLTLTGAAQSKYERYGLGIGFKKDF